MTQLIKLGMSALSSSLCTEDVLCLIPLTVNRLQGCEVNVFSTLRLRRGLYVCIWCSYYGTHLIYHLTARNMNAVQINERLHGLTFKCKTCQPE